MSKSEELKAEYEKMAAEHRSKVEGYFSTSSSDTWKRIEQLFNSQQGFIYDGMTMNFFLPLSFELIKKFVERFPKDYEQFFSESLSNANPKVVAYAIIGLSLAESSLLKTLDEGILRRPEGLKIMTGCLLEEMTLGEFALFKREQLIDYEKRNTKAN